MAKNAIDLLRVAKAMMLSVGLPRRNIDDSPMVLEFFADIDATIEAGNAIAPIPSEDEIARVIYEQDPFVDCGESIDSFQVAPGGPIGWDKACAMDAEFCGDPQYILITGFARKVANAVLERIKKGA
jgi:hypothetical protein